MDAITSLSRLLPLATLFAVSASSSWAQTSISDRAAVTNLLSRRSAAEAESFQRTLTAIRQHGNLPGFGPNTGFVSTSELLFGAASETDKAILKAAWDAMDNPDREEATILARAAYFGGLEGAFVRTARIETVASLAKPADWRSFVLAGFKTN